MAASVALRTYTASSVRLAGTPDRALAAGLPPVARTCRPNVVRPTMTETTMARAMRDEHHDRDAPERGDAQVR